jgi:hypothetical protein
MGDLSRLYDSRLGLRAVFSGNRSGRLREDVDAKRWTKIEIGPGHGSAEPDGRCEWLQSRYLLELVAGDKEVPMRRGGAYLIAVAAMIGFTSAALGQYPYPYPPMPAPYGPMPYAPMPAQYMQPYGPMPMQPYGPMPMQPYAPMPMQSNYYGPAPMMTQPAPMWQAPPAPPRNTKVFVYGPLLDETVTVVPAQPAPAPNPIALAPNSAATAVAPPNPAPAPTAPIAPAQATLTRGGKMLPTYSKLDLPPDACGDDCGPACGNACGPTCPPSCELPMHGRGHFIGEVGAYFLVPLGVNRTAFTASNAAGSTTTDFNREMEYGVRAALGYMSHNGWGVRASYEFLRGTASTGTANSDPTATFATPGSPPFQIVSPSAALAGGLGTDTFSMSQTREVNAVDIEALKQCDFLDTTFLIGVGARYARFTQTYSASRSNPGGNNGAVNVLSDSQGLDMNNRFEGWGPTVSLEVSHPLGCGFSIYGDVRGSFLWGRDRFAQTAATSGLSVDPTGMVTSANGTSISEDEGTRYVTVIETEAGVQFGHRFHKCYVFVRAGAVYQRWFDVGNPTTSNGSVTFVGGTVRAGITY